MLNFGQITSEPEIYQLVPFGSHKIYFLFKYIVHKSIGGDNIPKKNLIKNSKNTYVCIRILQNANTFIVQFSFIERQQWPHFLYHCSYIASPQ